MKAEEMMHKDPECCLPEDTLQSVSRVMAECGCGSIPVVENRQSMRLVGMITDRDIVCRAVALGRSPSAPARVCYSSPAVAATPETSLEDCLDMMEGNQVRRLPVVDDEGRCVGVVSQAQVARYATPEQTARLLRAVSEKTTEPSAAG